MIRQALVLLALIPLTSCAGSGTESAGAPSTVTVFAAASLQPAFNKIAAQLRLRDNIATTFNYAGTQTLTAQLTEGAQADVFASADIGHMTAMQNAGLIAGPPRIFAHNRLEIAVERGNPKEIKTLADLSRPGLVVVLADASVPAGKYARQALAKANVTVHPASLEPEVTGVLNKVALGEADAGIVYVSDVVTNGQVDGIAIPADQNVIAGYPIAALKDAQHKGAAADFMSFVLSPDGQAIMKSAGFEEV